MLVFGLVGLAGCSSSSPTATSKSTTTTSGSPQNVASDKSLAVAANLKLSDFPDGWTSTPQSSTSSGEQAIGTRLNSCLHTNLAIFDSKNPTAASSPSFGDSNNDTVASGADYLATASQAQSEMSVFTSSRFQSCMTTAMNALLNYELNNAGSGSTLPAGVSFGQATVSQMSFQTYGDQSVAYRVTVPFSYKGLNPDVYVDIVAVQKGRALAALFFESTGTPFESSMEEQLTSVVVGRLVQT
jgi:hypothetical protein